MVNGDLVYGNRKSAKMLIYLIEEKLVEEDFIK